jgi:hypothetical protein
MNRLVEAFLTRPETVDLAVEHPVAPFEVLLDVLGDALLDRSEREMLAGNVGLRRQLAGGYLPKVSAPEWDGALSVADPDPSGRPDWWTVMIPATSRAVGVTVPQDSSDRLWIALFTGPPDSASTLVYDPATARAFDLAELGHCSPPSRGRCAPGSCGGCRARTVFDPATGKGITCRCPDQAG